MAYLLMYKHKFYPTPTNYNPSLSGNRNWSQSQDKCELEDIEFDEESPMSQKATEKIQLNMDTGKDDSSTLFNDGVRKIDFVLVIQESVKGRQDIGVSEESQRLIADDDDAPKKLQKLPS